MDRLDIIVFGATGFTGRKAVQEFARLSKKKGFTWGVAGRSQQKLENVLVEAEKATGEELKNIKIVLADVNDDNTLEAMCSQAKIIANCCGPYRLYGEPVIKACIKAKTHHLDISGEPQFIETMVLKYGEAAATAGVYVISACGFDSIPNDMGVVYLQQNFDGILNSAESYMSVSLPMRFSWDAICNGSIHYGTWESLVHSIAHQSELKPLRKQLQEKLGPFPSVTPKLKPKPIIHSRGGCTLALPFLGADNSIVYRTQRDLYNEDKQRPVQFKAYICANFLTTLFVILDMLLVKLLSMTKFTTDWLLQYPRLFSFGAVTKDGPSEAVMDNTTFKVEIIGRGWSKGVDPETTPPNKTAVVTVRGVNPGYGATVTALAWSCLAVLYQHQHIPRTGVLTTGAAFSKTTLIQDLTENNLTFSIKQH